MMKRVCYILFVVMVIPLQLFAQEEEQNDYDKLKSYFIDSSEGINTDKSKIPFNLITRISGNDRIAGKNVVSVSPLIMIEIGSNTCFILEFFYPDGGYSSSYSILSLVNGDFKQDLSIGSNSISDNGGKSCTLSMTNDTVLEVRTETVEFNGRGEKVLVSEPHYKYYKFSSNGFSRVKHPALSRGRLYPQASIRILEESELKQYGRNELDIMRNEIYADHGYIFKSVKWKDYFAGQKWYFPCYENVLDFLTVIEEINIERILTIAPL